MVNDRCNYGSARTAALVPYPESPVPEWLQKLIKDSLTLKRGELLLRYAKTNED